MNNRSIIAMIFILGFIIVSASAALAMGRLHKPAHVQESQGTYYCPMHPNQISDKPGNCPICGMALIKKDNNAVQKKSTCGCCGMRKS